MKSLRPVIIQNFIYVYKNKQQIKTENRSLTKLCEKTIKQKDKQCTSNCFCLFSTTKPINNKKHYLHPKHKIQN